MKNEKKNTKKKDIEKSNNMILAIKFILPVVVALLIFLGFKIATNTYRMTVIDLEKYTSLVGGTKQSLIFVTSNDCDTCDNTKELLKKMLQGSKIKTYELNVDNMTDEEKEKFMNTFTETNESVTAPALLLVKENELRDNFYGPFDEDLIIEFLQENGLVKQVNNE